MKAWFRNNSLKLIWITVSISISLAYVRIFWDVKKMGLCWLHASIIIFLLISGLSFIFGGIVGDKKKTRRVKVGFLLGCVFFFVLFIALIKIEYFKYLFPDLIDEFQVLIWIMFSIGFFILLIDFLIGMEKEVIEMDVVYIICSFIITVIIPIVMVDIVNNDIFFKGFQSGAIAFQLIIFNLLFNPNLYVEKFKIHI